MFYNKIGQKRERVKWQLFFSSESTDWTARIKISHRLQKLLLMMSHNLLEIVTDIRRPPIPSPVLKSTVRGMDMGSLSIVRRG